MKALVLAAGRGERLWPLTETRPKHLLPLAGKAIVERTVSALVDAGVEEIVVVVNYRGEMIRSALDAAGFGRRAKYVRQRRVGGTADAIAAARDELEGEDRFLAVYGDDFYNSYAVRRFARSAKSGSSIVMATASVPDGSHFGTLEVKRGLVKEIREKVDRVGPAVVNAGLYCLDSSCLSAVARTKKSPRGELELTDSLRIALDDHKEIRTFPLKQGEWVGISYPWDLLKANRVAIEVDPVKRIGKAEESVRFLGKVIVSKGARVKTGCYVEGPVFIGEGAIVGPNTYLRPGTSLGRNVKLGGACEVKNSILMDGSKVPHLSYVGDSIIGVGAELGAGTITANLRFDETDVKSIVTGERMSAGLRKLGTVFGDGVKTGINVSMFPGVKVGAGAWIGPGMVVKRDVPSHARLM